MYNIIKHTSYLRIYNTTNFVFCQEVGAKKLQKVILHSDLNNFYASVECLNNPALRNKYVAVCGNEEERHGIVLAKNQLAKMKGVKTGDVIWEAKQKCPELVIVPPHYDEYMKYSKLTKEVYYNYTDLIEPFGMDECWLDVSGSQGLFGNGYEIASQIKEKVKHEVGLTVSIGVSFNKIFAKLGSDMKKPDAITCIKQETFKEQIWVLPASDLLGVGRATTKKLESRCIRTIGDIAKCPPDYLKRMLGVNGVALWKYANGLDASPVQSFDYKAPIKSMGHGITCVSDLINSNEVWCVMLELTQDISHKLRVNNLLAGGVAISVKDDTLYTKVYQCQFDYATHNSMDIAKGAFSLFEHNFNWSRTVRAVCVRAINLISDKIPQQISLFNDTAAIEKRDKVETAMESIRERYGKTAITYACLMGDLKMPKTKDVELIMPTGMVK